MRSACEELGNSLVISFESYRLLEKYLIFLLLYHAYIIRLHRNGLGEG
jgi:hypothetical protein